MLKKLIFILPVILAGCGNPPAPKEAPVRSDIVKHKAPAAGSAVNLWKINSFAPEEAKTEGRKYVRFVTDGDFSDTTQNKSYLYAEVLVDKRNAGIFLHELKKSNPPEKFSEPVQIKMTDSSGQELQMTSTRKWNSSGGILIERNNNDYSQFRIFMLQSKGMVTVEIKDTGTKIYHFIINADGFSDSFSKL
jgi:hypothetical protein